MDANQSESFIAKLSRYAALTVATLAAISALGYGIYRLTPDGRAGATKQQREARLEDAEENLQREYNARPRVVREFPGISRFPKLIGVVNGDNGDDPPVSRLNDFQYDPDEKYVLVDVTMDWIDDRPTRIEAMNKLASDVYIAVFQQKGTRLKQAIVRVTGGVPGKGHRNYMPVFETRLTADEAGSIDWNGAASTLEQDILPNAWEITYDPNLFSPRSRARRSKYAYPPTSTQ